MAYVNHTAFHGLTWKTVPNVFVAQRIFARLCFKLTHDVIQKFAASHLSIIFNSH